MFKLYLYFLIIISNKNILKRSRTLVVSKIFIINKLLLNLDLYRIDRIISYQCILVLLQMLFKNMTEILKTLNS